MNAFICNVKLIGKNLPNGNERKELLNIVKSTMLTLTPYQANLDEIKGQFEFLLLMQPTPTEFGYASIGFISWNLAIKWLSDKSTGDNIDPDEYETAFHAEILVKYDMNCYLAVSFDAIDVNVMQCADMEGEE